MTLLPPDHPERYVLSEEVHARPPEALKTPSRATYVAVLIALEQRQQERAHLSQLCKQFSVPAPAEEANHFSADLGEVRMKWERHGEFSSYTFYAAGSSPVPFSQPPVALLPTQWLARIPGTTIFAAHGKLIAVGVETPSAESFAAYFGSNVAVGAEIGGGAGLAFTDFRIHDDGFARFVVFDRSLTSRQAGRMMQRLFEIEAYRMMALLALPIAREQGRRIGEVERSLAGLTDEISRDGADDESLLQQLSSLAAEVERSLAASQFRFGACRAYHDLVTRRIAELRERQLPGTQTIEEFMARRFTPAAATCASVSQRLHDLSERVAQASALLSTRVDIARERQNQMLLESMNRRASLQLRLQQTVEVLSVAAIVYYLAGLIGYFTKALNAAGFRVNSDIVVGISILPLTLAVALTLRQVHRKIRGKRTEAA